MLEISQNITRLNLFNLSVGNRTFQGAEDVIHFDSVKPLEDFEKTKKVIGDFNSYWNHFRELSAFNVSENKEELKKLGSYRTGPGAKIMHYFGGTLRLLTSPLIGSFGNLPFNEEYESKLENIYK